MQDFTEDEMVEKILETYRKRGLTYKDETDQERLLHPTFQEADDVLVYSKKMIELLGAEAYEQKIAAFRKKAIESGIPEERVAADDVGDRIFEFTVSDETRDRYGDRILVTGRIGKKKLGDGWILKNFKKNPVFMAFHGYSSIPLGNAVDTWTDVKKGRLRLRQAVLMDDGESNPAAPLFSSAYTARLIRAVSVGFDGIKVIRPETTEEREELDLGPYGWLFVTQELWEVSAVSIPANPNALLEKDTGAEEVERLNTQIGGLDYFTHELEDVGAGELAYSIRSALPSQRKTVDAPAEPKPPQKGPGAPASGAPEPPCEPQVPEPLKAALNANVKPAGKASPNKDLSAAESFVELVSSAIKSGEVTAALEASPLLVVPKELDFADWGSTVGIVLGTALTIPNEHGLRFFSDWHVRTPADLPAELTADERKARDDDRLMGKATEVVESFIFMKEDFNDVEECLATLEDADSRELIETEVFYRFRHIEAAELVDADTLRTVTLADSTKLVVGLIKHESRDGEPSKKDPETDQAGDSQGLGDFYDELLGIYEDEEDEDEKT